MLQHAENAQGEQSTSFFSELTALLATQEPSGERCSEHRDWQTPIGLPFQKTARGGMLRRRLRSRITPHHRCDMSKKVSYKTRAPSVKRENTFLYL